MRRRCDLRSVAAAWVVAAGIAAQAPPAGTAVTLCERIAATTARMPARSQRVKAEHVEQLEQLRAALPPSLSADEQRELTELLRTISTRWLDEGQRSALEPRVFAWCEGLAAHPSVGPDAIGCLSCWEGELHYTARRADAAVAAYVRAAASADHLRPSALGRAFRIELARQHYRAARVHLDAAKPGMGALRQVVYEAHFAERLGLFDRAARLLDSAKALAAAEEAERNAAAEAKKQADAEGRKEKAEPLPPIDTHALEQLALVDLELLLLRKDFEALEPRATAVMQQYKALPATHDRAFLRVLSARIGRDDVVPLAVLDELFARASDLNKPDIAVMWIAEALRAGDAAAAAAVAAKLLDGKPLDDATVTLQALVAAGQSELHPDRIGTLDGERRQQWIAALERGWEPLLREWREVEADGEALAFLQMDLRRDALSLLLRAHAVDPGAGPTCLGHYLAADASGSTARRLGLPVATPEQVVQRLVPARGALLVFVPAAVGSHVLIAAHDGIEVVPLPPEGTLRRKVFALRKALADSDGANDDASLRVLAQAVAEHVLPPALATRLARYGTLVIAGYELLHALPLELLPLADEPRWLGLRHPIVYVPSVTLALHLAERAAAAPAPSPSARVLAATRIAAADESRFGHAAVRVGESTLREIVAAIAPDAVTVRRDATAVDLATAEPVAFGLVVAPGVRDASRSCPSGMLLGSARDDTSGAVFATDLPTVGLPRVTCLGVCGARRSSLKAGEDGGHRFTSAFLAGGSDAVLATDLDVRLDEAQAVFTACVDELMVAPELATALLQARRRLAAAGAGVRAWTAFRLEGLPTTEVRLPAAPPAAFGPWRLSAIGGALALVLSAAVVRRRSRRT